MYVYVDVLVHPDVDVLYRLYKTYVVVVSLEGQIRHHVLPGGRVGCCCLGEVCRLPQWGGRTVQVADEQS